MISAFQSALSALQAFGTRLQANGSNLANASTEGFKKNRVILANVDPQGVRAFVDRVQISGNSASQESSEGLELVELSNVELSSELPEMSLNSTLYKANLKTITTVSEMTGALLDIKS